MNRYIYLNGYVKPPLVFYNIEVGQIWRGIRCSANPMLLEVLHESSDGVKVWYVKGTSPGDNAFLISPDELIANYVIDRWGAI